jgi:hypothetical protein
MLQSHNYTDTHMHFMLQFKLKLQRATETTTNELGLTFNLKLFQFLALFRIIQCAYNVRNLETASASIRVLSLKEDRSRIYRSPTFFFSKA